MENYKCQYCTGYCLENLETGYECINCHKSSTKIINENKSIIENEIKIFKESNDLKTKITSCKNIYNSAKVYYNI